MAQRFLLRIDTLTGNIHGDGDVVIGNVDDWVRPSDEGKPWVKTPNYIESAYPSEYEPIDKRGYFGFSEAYNPDIVPGTAFDVRNAKKVADTEFTRPLYNTVATVGTFPTDVLRNPGDELYITTAMSVPAEVMYYKKDTYGYRAAYLGNLDIADNINRDDIVARMNNNYCPFHLYFYTGTGSGANLSYYKGKSGIPAYKASRYSQIEFRILETNVTDPLGDGAILATDLLATNDRVSIFSECKLTATEYIGPRVSQVNAEVNYYTDSGILLASRTWSDRVEKDTISLSIAPLGGSYATAPNIIMPGIRIHNFSVSTERVDRKSVFPDSNAHFLDANGLRIAWGIQKSWTVSKITEHSGNSDIHVNNSDRARWDAKSEFSGNYDDLEGKPIITNIDASPLTDDEIKTILEL